MAMSKIDSPNNSENKVDVIDPSVEILTPIEVLAGMEQRIEAAGRTCYKSEDRITEGSAAAFIRTIMKNEHVSVIEHESISARFIMDRTASHQLVRHRIAAYSQESQRYCNYGKKGFQFICPPSIQNDPFSYRIWYQHRQRNIEEYNFHIANKTKPEDARCCLPGCSKTEVVATYNLRTWRHLFEDRALNPKAQWQIRGLMQICLQRLAGKLPTVFKDQMDRLVANPKIWIDF